MTERSIVIIGLPGSGKTTFLAALWHLVMDDEDDTALRFHKLSVGDMAHLNRIAERWREAKEQDRTGIAGHKMVSMNLLDGNKMPVRVTFPDVPGEAYRRMWEDRECDPEIADIMDAEGVLLFIHSDSIVSPSWVVDEVTLARQLGIDVPKGQEVDWHPRLAPTQVQIVDLLQLLCEPPLDVGPRRLAIMLSAWDKAKREGLSPSDYIDAKLPLLGQYLRQGVNGWTCQIYGISAQGGDYDPVEPDQMAKPQAELLRKLDRPSARISLINGYNNSHDLTEPLAWLMQ
ncbi:MAG: hypothetical protein RLO04_01970 [Limnobacter sp.]|jgi:GTPase SAR1 family protein|uniref:TRAFAC clade GTPase domain-containing protein n=1 Tax=Limnobacter sp. TaxID=2003368 RepID=UPI0032F084DE